MILLRPGQPAIVSPTKLHPTCTLAWAFPVSSADSLGVYDKRSESAATSWQIALNCGAPALVECPADAQQLRRCHGSCGSKMRRHIRLSIAPNIWADRQSTVPMPGNIRETFVYQGRDRQRSESTV
ncbi:hypothetical protein VTO73DRAFT_6688 [Trametes versicolor]